MKVKQMILLLLFIAGTGFTMAQPQKRDSLKNLLDTPLQDTAKADVLIELAFLYYRSNSDRAMNYAKRALIHSKKIGNRKREARSHRKIGMIYAIQADYKKALDHFETARSIFQSTGYKQGLIKIYNDFGQAYHDLGEYVKSIDHYTTSKNLAEELKNTDLTSMVYNNLGTTLHLLGEYDSAMSYYFKSLSLTPKDYDRVSTTNTNVGLIKLALGEYEAAEQHYLKSLELDILSGDNWGVANNYENIGELKFKQEKFAEAYNYFDKARQSFAKIKDRNAVAVNDNFLGQVLQEGRDFELAMTKFTQSLEIYKETGNRRGMSIALLNMADCQLEMGQAKKGIELAKRSLTLATALGAIAEEVKAAKMLHELYGNIGNYQKAYEYSLKHMLSKDSLFDLQKIEHISQIESRHQLSILQKENQLLIQENQIKVSELDASNLKIQRQYAIVFALIICLLFAISTAIFWYRFNLRKQKTIRMLEGLNTRIIKQKEQISSQATELEKVNTELTTMNESLENIVFERTKKIRSQNKTLREYAFSNSHEVRAPLANLLGLAQVSKIETLSKAEQREVIDKIYISAVDLDSIITKVNKILEQENL